MRSKATFPILMAAGLICAATAVAQTTTDESLPANRGVETTVRHPTVPMHTAMVGARLGTVDAQSLGGLAIGYGVFGDYSIVNNVLVGVTLDYWSNSAGTLNGNGVEVSDVALGAGGKLLFTNVNVPFRPFVSAGVAMHRFTASMREQETEINHANIDKFNHTYKDIENEPGLDVGAGAAYRLQKSVDLLGELRYRRMLNPGLNLDQVSVAGALAYQL